MRRLGRALALVTLSLAAVAGGAGPAGAAEGSVAFADPAPETLEGRGAVRIVVDRVDLPVSRLVVSYTTEDGSAMADSDYVATSGSLVFEVGARQATFVVQIRDDEVAEAGEHLVLRLVADRSSTTARLAIVDDDVATSTPPAVASSSSSAASASGRPAPSSSSAAPAGSAAAAGTASVAPRQQVAPVRRRVSEPPARRRVVLKQSPVTPFELRPAAPTEDASGSLPNEPTLVDPVLALVAGLLLARVSAEVWFRSRAVAA